MTIADSDWATDESLIASLPGGRAVIDWFGFCPGFHDGTLEKLELAGGDASLSVRAFRMTRQVNDEGFYATDRHAIVTMRLRGVSGIKLEGDARSIIGNLSIRRLPSTPDRSDWESCAGPVAGDIEIAFDAAVGLYGSIFARELEFELEVLPLATSA